MSDALNTAQSKSENSRPDMLIRAQYLRDFSFESPEGPIPLIGTEEQPRIDVQVSVKHKNIEKHGIECGLTLRVQSVLAEKTLFIAEGEYAALVTFTREIDREVVKGLLNIEVPRLLFPFARQVIMESIVAGGFPPLNINPVDFNQIAKAAQEQQAAQMAPASETIQ